MMKSLLPVVLLFTASSALKAQDRNTYYVDARATYFPASATSSTLEMAKYIGDHFQADDEKVRAAYRWITANIRYDKDSMLAINWSKENDEKIAATMRRKKGVCDNFASAFTDILLKMHINSFVVNGLCNTAGSVLKQAHSWSAVQLDNKWYLCDPTWDIAYATNPRYFLATPDEFIASHWPFDPLWQLLPYPISFTEFEKGFTSSSKNKGYFNVADSVKTFLALDNLQQMEASARRMKTNGDERETLKNWYAYNQMNIAIVYGEKDMQLYNAAVADLNKATTLFNNFVQYRNNFFLPARRDDEIQAMLQPVKDLIISAEKKTETMGLINENFQYDTGDLKDRLASLSKKTDEQKHFLNRYFATNTAEREKLFYK
jgi:hypothetical protein